MPPQRSWWFTKEDDDIFVMVLAFSKKGPQETRLSHPQGRGNSIKPFPRVVDLTSFDKKPSYVKIVCEDGTKAARPRDDFDWSKNSFCRNFRTASTPASFVQRFRELMNVRNVDVSCSTEESTQIPSQISEAAETSEPRSLSGQSVSFSEMEFMTQPDESEDLLCLQSPRTKYSSSERNTDETSECPDVVFVTQPPDSYDFEETPSTPTQRAEVQRSSSANTTKRGNGSPMPGLLKKLKKGVTSGKAPNRLQVASEKCRVAVDVYINIANLQLGEQARGIDTSFVKSLVQSMRTNPDPSYQSLYVVANNVDQQHYDPHKVNAYKYTVIGGQHQYMAALELSRKEANPFFNSRRCIVYAGTTEEEMLWLSMEHNRIAANRHDITFREKLTMCRRRLENMPERDDKMRVWKESCQLILEEDYQMMRMMCFLASLDDSAFRSLCNIMDMFETGELKHQKLKKKEKVSLPDFGKTAYTLRPLMGLDDTTVGYLLGQVEEGYLSTGELREEAMRLKKLTEVQQVFCNHMGCQSWEDAENLYPEAANREVLFRFLPGFKPTDSRLKEYCWKLKKRHEPGISRHEGYFCGKACGFVLTGDILEVNNASIKAKFPDFQGAELTILDLPEEWGRAELAGFCGTIQNLNATESKTHYSLVVLCRARAMHFVTDMMTSSGFFLDVEDAFYYINNAKKEQGRIFREAVGGIVVAVANRKGTVDKHQLNVKNADNLLTVSMDDLHTDDSGEVVNQSQKPSGLCQKLIKLLSNEGDTVIDACCGTGTVLMSALPLNRNCVAVDQDANQTRFVEMSCDILFSEDLSANSISEQSLPSENEDPVSPTDDSRDIADA